MTRSRAGMAFSCPRLLPCPTRLALALTLVLAGCGGDGAAEREPRPLNAGVDVCEYCHMPVDDGGRAALWLPESGSALTFDEPGCLVAWLQRHPGAAGRAYVAAGEAGGWRRAEEAVYLTGRVRTGMGFDVVALAAPPSGPEEVGLAGEVISWAELNRRGVRDAHRH